MNRIAIVRSAGGKHKADLETKLRELINLSGMREDVQVEYLADPLDQVVSSTNREMAIRQLDRLTHEIREVRAALDKIGAGGYGICEQCADPIAPKRLNAVPWARLCLACQSHGEARGSLVVHQAA